MVEQKEFQRVMAITRAHAREALSKHDSQRESFLGYCRNNWKRYAASLSRSKGECERFAAALDSATRDLITLVEAAPNAEAAAEILRSDPPPPWDDSLEGATDSVIMHEAYQGPAFVPETNEPSRPDDVAPPAVAAVPPVPLAPPLSDAAVPPETAEQILAEEEDRLAARYGFRAPGAGEPTGPGAEPPEHAQELQRKVRAVLLAHRTKGS